jgi:hypothetical protein
VLKAKYLFPVSLIFIGAACVNQGSHPAPQEAVIKPTTSVFQLSVRPYNAGVPDPNFLRISETTAIGKFKRDLSQTSDYSIAMTEQDPSLGGALPFEIDIQKTSAAGINDPEISKSKFNGKFSFQIREKPVAGKLYTCSANPQDSACVVKMDLSYTLPTESLDDVGPVQIIQLKDPTKLECDFEIATWSNELAMTKNADGSLSLDGKLPSDPRQSDANSAKVWGMIFRCRDVSIQKNVLQGSFVQNSTQAPVFDPNTN